MESCAFVERHAGKSPPGAVRFPQTLVAIGALVAALGCAAKTGLPVPGNGVTLYQLGKDLPYSLSDLCDAAPTIQIVKVSSNQPDVGGGQGNFTPDFMSGGRALCLRSERQGTVMWDREYTIQIAATDSSNHTTTKYAVVRVPHDQSGAAKCASINPARLVDESDPRCTAN